MAFRMAANLNVHCVEDLRGRWRLESPEESCAKSEEVWDRAEDRMASRIFCSSLFAIVSAALPRGARMIGTCPVGSLEGKVLHAHR